MRNTPAICRVEHDGNFEAAHGMTAQSSHSGGIPVFVITGFLGSGKTTLLNRLVNRPGMGDTAVIVNEFGEIGLDHLLVESAFEDTVLMAGGCICCGLRGDLVDTLALLATRRDNGELPGFARVIVETTGLADPAPLLQTLMSDPNVLKFHRLGGVVATVDAINGPRQFDEHAESVKQVAVAERIVLTKTDIATPDQRETALARLAGLNPAAPVFQVVDGEIEPDKLFDAALYDPRNRDWLTEAPDTHAHTGANRHGDDIRTFCLIRENPVEWRALRVWLESVVASRGADLLRVKGIVNVAGEDRPVVVHGVQHIFHKPVRLVRWPDADRRTRIVFITRGIEQGDLERAFEAANQQ